jgi:hypothetical protein
LTLHKDNTISKESLNFIAIVPFQAGLH